MLSWSPIVFLRILCSGVIHGVICGVTFGVTLGVQSPPRRLGDLLPFLCLVADLLLDFVFFLSTLFFDLDLLLLGFESILFFFDTDLFFVSLAAIFF